MADSDVNRCQAGAWLLHVARPFVAALRERGVDVEYLLAPDEGHGFRTPRTCSPCSAAWIASSPPTSGPCNVVTSARR